MEDQILLSMSFIGQTDKNLNLQSYIKHNLRKEKVLHNNQQEQEVQLKLKESKINSKFHNLHFQGYTSNIRWFNMLLKFHMANCLWYLINKLNYCNQPGFYIILLELLQEEPLLQLLQDQQLMSRKLDNQGQQNQQ